MASRIKAFKYSGESPLDDPAWRVAIAPGPSRRAGAWVGFVGAMALATTLAAALPPAAQAVVACAVGCAVVRALRLHGWREGIGAVRSFVVDLSGRIVVEPAHGPTMAGRIAGGSFVAPWLTIVRWVPDGARRSRTILLLPDMAGEQDLRRLRVLLRWGDFRDGIIRA